jgi:hypothetical protein
MSRTFLEMEMHRFYVELVFQFLMMFCRVTGYSLSVVDHVVDPTNKCLNKILSKHYDSENLTVFVDTNLRTTLPVVYQNSSAEQFKIFDGSSTAIYVITVIADNPLKAVLASIENSQIFNPRAKFIVIVPEATRYEEVFTILSKYFIYNVVLVNSKNDIITYDPFVHEDSNTYYIRPVIMEDCAKSLSVDVLFNKTFPLLWRNSTVASIYSEHFPYLYHKNGRLEGENYEIFKIIQEKLQFRLTLEERKAVLNGTHYTDLLGVLFAYSVSNICIRYVAVEAQACHDQFPDHQCKETLEI